MTLYEALSEPGSVRGLPGVFQGSSRVFQGFRHGSLPCSGPKWCPPRIGTKDTNTAHRPAFRWGKISPQDIYGCGPRKTRLHPLRGSDGTGTLVPVQISGATEVHSEEVALFKDVPWLVGFVQVRTP